MRQTMDLETSSTDKGSSDILNENGDWMDIYIMNNRTLAPFPSLALEVL